MDKKVYLDPEFSFGGESRIEFRNVISGLDSVTSRVLTETNNLLVLHLIEESEDELKFLLCGCTEPFTPQTKLKATVFKKDRFTPSLIKELKQNSLCLYDTTNKRLYVVARSADFNCLGFFGNISRRNNLPRALMLAEAIRERIDDLSLIVREAGEPLIRKVVGIRSQRYVYLPQKLIDEVISEFEKHLGPVGDVRYKVEPETTEISVSFPEKTEELSGVYGRSVVPGVFISTSDTGDSAFHIVPTIWVGADTESEVYSPKAVNVRHYADASPKKIVDGCGRVFAEFTEIPKKLCALAEISLFDDGTKSDNLVAYSALVDDICEKIKLSTAIGSRAMVTAKAALILGYGGEAITAYDVAEKFLTLPVTIGGLSVSTAAHLKEAVYGVINYDFDREFFVK